MKLFEIHYDGVYLGGVALVCAEGPNEALELLRYDPKSFGAKDAEVREVELKVGLIYNFDGDY